MRVMSEIEIHYNAFETIEEQLKEQGFLCKDIELYEKAKDSIMYLWVDGYLTESEWDKLINKLHKKIIKNVKKVEG
jgi:adenosine deaminase